MSIKKMALVALLMISGVVFAVPARAVTAQELKNKLEALQLQLKQLQAEMKDDAIAKVNPAVVSISIHKPIKKVSVIYREHPELGIKENPVYEMLSGPDTQVIGGGTGFVVDNSGYVVTNNHVLSDGNAIITVTFFSGDSRKASVVHQDIENDIAILKIEGTYFAAAKFGDSDILKSDEEIFAIGNDLGKNINVVAGGVISKLNQTITIEDEKRQEKNLKNTIQINARVRRGYSGSPLFNLNGEVVGIVVAVANRNRPIAFALPINHIRPIIERALGK